MNLVGDIGGTNSRFSIIGNTARLLKIKVYKNKDFKNIYQLIERYIFDVDDDFLPEKVVLAVAGPVIKDSVELTSLKWKFSVSSLRKKFKFIKKLCIVNDLQALSASALYLKNKDIKIIKDTKRLKEVPKAFIAPGTGLGEALLVSKDPLITLPTEGGHIYFSPLNDEEYSYLNFLKEKKEELSWEKALSGIAISYWYEFYYGEKLSPEKVTELARAGDEKAKKVILKIFELFGRKVSQIAFTTLPFGGVYLAGGVTQALKEFFNKKEFLEAFFKNYYSNTKMKKVLENIPIYIIEHPYPVLLGALSILRNQL